MSILSRRSSTRLALVIGAVLAIAAIVVLSFVLRDRGVPVPTDGIGDIPTARLVPEDAAIYVGMTTDLDSGAWLDTFALLERLGMDDPLGTVRAGIEDESDIAWADEIEPFLGGAVVAFLSSPGGAGGEDAGGAVIFRANDASAAEAVILDRRSDGFAEAAYSGVAYKVMEEGGVLAVIGDHFVYASDERTLRSIVDADQGESRALADADDFRRLRNLLEGEALAFLYIRPEALLDEATRESAEGSPEEQPDLLELVGLDRLFTEPIGVVVRTREDSFRVQAAMLGDPGPLVPLLRPRESRFAAMVPAGTAIFVSTYDIAGVVDEAFGSTGFAARLRASFLESADENGDLAHIEDLLGLLEGEVAFALWIPDGGDDIDFVLLAEVDNEEYASELLRELLAESLETGEVALSVEDGVAILGPSAAVEAVRAAPGAALAGSERFADTVATLDEALATFAYVDITRFLTAMAEDLDGAELEDDALGLIVNLFWEDDRMQIEAALTFGAD